MIACGIVIVLILWTLYHLRLRQVGTSLTNRFNERLAERTRIAQDLHDTFLQTIQGSKLVADDALDRPRDPAHMRQAMEKISDWLAQATVPRNETHPIQKYRGEPSEFWGGEKARAHSILCLHGSREEVSTASYVAFQDPDGNAWIVQEVTKRAPGRELPR